MSLTNTLADRYTYSKNYNRLSKNPFPFPYYPFVHCSIKMLVVTDGSGSYKSQNPNAFSLVTFLKAFNEPLPFTSFDITTAHRSNSNITEADEIGFEFDQHNLNQYDVILLFGVSRTDSISESELRSITEFMDEGGGVFATGDHEDLGLGLCGKIPRVRSMRRWHWPMVGPNGEQVAPGQIDGTQYDTIDDQGGSEFDLGPQTIRPVYRTSFVYPGYGTGSIFQFVKYPHPVLCSIDGVIKVLPDHMHEGNCEVPTNLTDSFTFDGYTTEEYPLVNGQNTKPEIVAHATNHNDNANIDQFGVICALDGHKHSTTGRVLVESTWHHHFYININQYENLKVSVNNGYVPTQQEQDALDAYNFFQHYYRNIVYWLARREKQNCFKVRGWIWWLNYEAVRMSINDIKHYKTKFEKIMYFHTVGVVARNALGDLQSNCQSPFSIFDFYPDFLVRVRKVTSSRFSFVDPNLFESVCLGCTLHELNGIFEKKKGDVSLKQIEELAKKSSFESMELLLDVVGQSLGRIRKKIRSRK